MRPPVAGDLPPGPGGLPRPPGNVGNGLPGLGNAFAQLVNLIMYTLPYLARRVASDVDVHRGRGGLG